jgi:3-hydroxyisobutyrate dehydrogenase-like beta-hydroxyacid dehydrogenase
MRVGVVGAGRMGRPMARRLAEAGHDVRVFGRSAATRTALEADGLCAVADLADVAAEVVVVCVFTDEQVREVCLGGDLLTHLPRGATLVVHTTGNPRTVEAIAEHAAPRGIGVVDAPVSGGPHDVAAGRITLFTGGADDDVARVRPVLDAYGDPVLHVGPLGSGQRVKLVNNALFAAQVGLVADAIRFGTELGVAEAVLLDALPHGSAASRALAGVAGRGSVAAFASTVGDFVGKDVAVVRAVAAELGSALGALEVADLRRTS